MARVRPAPPGGSGLALVSDHVDGRSRSAVAAVRALGLAGYRPFVTVTVSGGRSAAAASRWCAGRLDVPAPGTPGYREAVESFVAARPGTPVVAASDAVLIALGRPGADLTDKATVRERADAAGLPTPPTREFADGAELLRERETLGYPLVLKPAVKRRPSDTARRVDSADQLAAAVAGLPGMLVVQPFATGTMRAVCGVIADGRLRAAVHQRYVRIWPPECGTASAAVTTPPDLDVEERLPELLAGHRGVFQVQFVGDQVIDINPRVYGSLPLAVAAGANLPALACRLEAGDEGSGLVRGRPGVRYRWLEGDLRRVLHDRRTGSLSVDAAVRALIPHRGTAHSVESLTDPGPLLSRLMVAARGPA